MALGWAPPPSAAPTEADTHPPTHPAVAPPRPVQMPCACMERPWREGRAPTAGAVTPPPARSRALVSSERLHLPPELWVQTLRELLVPVATGADAVRVAVRHACQAGAACNLSVPTCAAQSHSQDPGRDLAPAALSLPPTHPAHPPRHADLAKLAGPKSRSHPGAEKSVRLAVGMLVKTVLQVGPGAGSWRGIPTRHGAPAWLAAMHRLADGAPTMHRFAAMVPPNVAGPAFCKVPSKRTAGAPPGICACPPPCSTSRWCRPTRTSTLSGRPCCRRCRWVGRQAALQPGCGPCRRCHRRSSGWQRTGGVPPCMAAAVSRRVAPPAPQDCMAVRHEAVQESVPENAKNMLLVLASSGILTPSWKVRGSPAPAGWPWRTLTGGRPRACLNPALRSVATSAAPNLPPNLLAGRRMWAGAASGT